MVAAVVLSVGLMMCFASAIGRFVSAHPTIKMLALSFLFVIGTVLMADIRRKLTDLDRRLLAWVPDGVRLVVTLTKSDKLPRQQARQALRDVIDELEQLRPGANNKVLLFSALNRSGSDDLTAVVENWIAVGLPASPKDSTNA
jgi:putative ribosome biogenesis GTPase RsgA